MADAVTYADLRFAEAPRREKIFCKTPHKRDSEFLDDTYENVDKSSGQKKVIDAPPNGRWHRLLKGLRLCAPHLALLFLLLSLILSTITIERTIKYLHVSRELQALTASHQAMNRSVVQNEQRQERAVSSLRRDLQNTEQRVTQLTASTERLHSSLQRAGEELQTQKNMAARAQTELERAEKRLSEEQAKLSQRERDICPEDWILVDRKCVLISDVKGGWTNCVEFCKGRDANLIVVSSNDLTLQVFLSNKTEDFWVGKKFTWKGNTRSWEWPDLYWIQTRNCLKISNKDLMFEECSEKKRCVCEKNLVLTTIRTHPSIKDYQLPHLILSGSEYYCFR